MAGAVRAAGSTATGGGGSTTTGADVTGAPGSGVAGLDLNRTVIRVDAAPGEDVPADVAALANTGVRYVMVPKAEGPDDVDRVVAVLPEAGVVALW